MFDLGSIKILTVKIVRKICTMSSLIRSLISTVYRSYANGAFMSFPRVPYSAPSISRGHRNSHWKSITLILSIGKTVFAYHTSTPTASLLPSFSEASLDTSPPGFDTLSPVLSVHVRRGWPLFSHPTAIVVTVFILEFVKVDVVCQIDSFAARKLWLSALLL